MEYLQCKLIHKNCITGTAQTDTHFSEVLWLVGVGSAFKFLSSINGIPFILDLCGHALQLGKYSHKLAMQGLTKGDYY